jgi:hypothetical protein
MVQPVSLPDSNSTPTPADRITHVIDLRHPERPVVAVDALLGDLDATGLALLRRADRASRVNGTPLFLCSACDEPVHIRVTSVFEAGVTDGRRASFVHDRRPQARHCPWGALAGKLDAKRVDGARFRGRHEGGRHARLKQRICEAALADPLVADAECEVRVDGLDGAGRACWRQPDVMIWLKDGRQLALDLQIAPPLLTTIDARERFYRRAGIGWHWIVDAAQPMRLWRQGFQDVILPQGGLVLGVEDFGGGANWEDARLVLLKLTEDATRWGFEVRSADTTLPRALALAGHPAGPAPLLATDLRTIAFRRAILGQDLIRAAQIFDLMAMQAGSPNWASAQTDGLINALTLMIVILDGASKTKPALTPADCLAMIEVHFAATAGPPVDVAARSWAPLLTRLIYARPDLMAASNGSAARRQLDAALAAIALDPTPVNQLHDRWRPILERLFPGLFTPVSARQT